MKYNNEWFLNKVKEKRPNDYLDYVFLEEYVNAKTYILAKHLTCGKNVRILPNTFLSRGSGCPECAKKSRVDSQRKSQSEVESQLPVGMIALDMYQGAFVPLKVHCFFCDSTYNIVVKDLLRSNECTHCSKMFRRTVEDIRLEISSTTNKEYTLLSESYKNAHTHIQIRHEVCGQYYPVTMHNFRKGRRCPHCSLSIGETLVRKVLDSLEVPYEQQVKFEGLCYKNPLSYDFYLPDYNVLIEYQGEQHYKPIKHFGGEDSFSVQKEIDNVKRNFASDAGIRLLEIPYTSRKKEDIQNIIVKILFEVKRSRKAERTPPNRSSKI